MILRETLNIVGVPSTLNIHNSIYLLFLTAQRDHRLQYPSSAVPYPFGAAALHITRLRSDTIFNFDTMRCLGAAFIAGSSEGNNCCVQG